jgi:hypothetical protein
MWPVLARTWKQKWWTALQNLRWRQRGVDLDQPIPQAVEILDAQLAAERGDIGAFAQLTIRVAMMHIVTTTDDRLLIPDPRSPNQLHRSPPEQCDQH